MHLQACLRKTYALVHPMPPLANVQLNSKGNRGRNLLSRLISTSLCVAPASPKVLAFPQTSMSKNNSQIPTPSLKFGGHIKIFMLELNNIILIPKHVGKKKNPPKDFSPHTHVGGDGGVGAPLSPTPMSENAPRSTLFIPKQHVMGVANLSSLRRWVLGLLAAWYA